MPNRPLVLMTVVFFLGSMYMLFSFWMVSSTPPVSVLETPTPSSNLNIRHVAEPTPAVLIGAGDISLCGMDGDDRTSALILWLLSQFPHAEVFTAGDNAQSMGELYEYTDCFHLSWGRFKDRIHPSPGNHDWYTEQGSNYFFYFGDAAGSFGQGYYSYDLGDWHIVSLNSNCNSIDCSDGSPQAQWLRQDLQQSSSRCTLLYWHHPLWSSGQVPIETGSETFWRIASEYNADVLVTGHDHHYERFTPLDWNGNISSTGGIRSFIVATGGSWMFDLNDPLPITEAVDNTTFGVIKFLLYPDRYEWEFIPVDGGTFTDSGEGTCT